MIEEFRNYLSSKSSIPDAEIDLIIDAAQPKKLRKRQYLLQEGDVWRYNAFVAKGFLRTYSIDDHGHEHIIQFAPESWWVGDRASYESGAPSIYNIEALEESEVVLISKPDFEKLCQEIPALNDLIKTLLHRSFIAAQARIHTAITRSADDKYQQFLESYPQIAARVPQAMIASYLGITPETLSRVRKHEAKKK